MVSTQFNIFDAVVIGVMVISILIAFFRGFVREILSLFAWIGAGIITIYLFPHSVDFVKHHVKSSNESVIAGMAALGTYVLALVVLSIIAAILMRYVKTNAEVGMLDNMLGLLFGALRGAFIVSLGYLLLSVTLPEDKEDYPEWLKGSRTQAYAAEGAEYLRIAAPKYIADMQKETQAMRARTEEHMREAASRAEEEKDHLKDELKRPDIPSTLEPLSQDKP